MQLWKHYEYCALERLRIAVTRIRTQERPLSVCAPAEGRDCDRILRQEKQAGDGPRNSGRGPEYVKRRIAGFSSLPLALHSGNRLFLLLVFFSVDFPAGIPFVQDVERRLLDLTGPTCRGSPHDQDHQQNHADDQNNQKEYTDHHPDSWSTPHPARAHTTVPTVPRSIH